MPVFDIYCNNCKEESEVVGEIGSLICPVCKSRDIKRKWTGNPMIVMKGEINGSTVGVRKKAKEITKKEIEKLEKKRFE